MVELDEGHRQPRLVPGLETWEPDTTTRPRTGLRRRPVGQRAGGLGDTGIETVFGNLTSPRRHGRLAGVEPLTQRELRPRHRRGQRNVDDTGGTFGCSYRKVRDHLGDRPVERKPGRTTIRTQHSFLSRYGSSANTTARVT